MGFYMSKHTLNLMGVSAKPHLEQSSCFYMYQDKKEPFFRYAQNAKKALIRVPFLIVPNHAIFFSLLFFAHEVLDHAAKHLEAKKYSSFLLIAHADARKAL